MATDKQQGGREAPPFSAQHLDIAAFAEAGACLAGETVLSHYPRLADEVLDTDQDTPVRWQAQGQLVPVLGCGPECWLELDIGVDLPLQCQRCLEPMRQPLQVSRRFRFVRDEATAEMLDDELEDDVLVISRDFDLHGLIEDELLMELPVAPRHDVCPQQPRMQVQTADFREEEAEKPNPFAALEALKKPRS